MQINEIVVNDTNSFESRVLQGLVQRRAQLMLEFNLVIDTQHAALIELLAQFDADFVDQETSVQATIPFAAWATFADRCAAKFMNDPECVRSLTAITRKYEVHWQTTRFDFNISQKPIIYGILNITPDSFYDGGRFQDPVAIADQIERMIAAGVTVIEVGGQTTRPGGFVEVTPVEELRRISSTVTLIQQHYPQVAVAVDTYKLPVMQEMVRAGVDIINDVNAFTDVPDKLALFANSKTGLLTMHSSRDTEYDNLTREMKRFFETNLSALTAAGIDRERIALDQGIGYSKVADGYQDYAMMRNIDQFNYLGRPMMVAISRKGFGAKLFGLKKDDRLPVTLIAEAYMYLHGGRILRVHDVEETVQLTKMLDTINAGYWQR